MIQTNRILRAGLVFLLATGGPALAQTPEFNEVLDQVNDNINQIVNATTLFTSHESVSSGYYSFESENGAPETKVDIFKLPARLSLSHDGHAAVRPFVRGQLAFLKVTESIPAFEGGGTDDFSTIDQIAADIGGGVEMLLAEGLLFTPEVSVGYSRIENNYDYNNNFSRDNLKPLFDELAFNWDLDVFTVTPRVTLVYTLPMDPVNVSLSSRYAYLYNDSIHSTSEILDISSSSGLWQNGIEATVPLGLSLFDGPLAVRPYFIRSDMSGDARRGLRFGHFYELGADLALGTSKSLGVLSELSFGTSYTFGDKFDGWRIGFGYDF